MNKQVPEILMKRINKLMAERFLSKKEMAERLGMEYLTFWRKLNGKRGIDVILLAQIADVLGTSTAYLMGETENPNRNTNISSSVDKEPDIVTRPEAPISYGYWGDVTDKARDVAVSGDEDTIAYVTQMLRRALSLLTSKTTSERVHFSGHVKTNITNNPFMIGERNESNLTVAPVH